MCSSICYSQPSTTEPQHMYTRSVSESGASINSGKSSPRSSHRLSSKSISETKVRLSCYLFSSFCVTGITRLTYRNYFSMSHVCLTRHPGVYQYTFHIIPFRESANEFLGTLLSENTRAFRQLPYTLTHYQGNGMHSVNVLFLFLMLDVLAKLHSVQKASSNSP